MPRTTPRRTVARGIYADATGYSIQVMVNGERAERRMPLGTSEEALIEARDALRASLATRTHKAGTLAQDAERYLAAVRAMPSYTSRRRLIELWVAVMGEFKRKDIQPAGIRAALGAFQRTYSPQYCRHLLRSLQHLYTVLDGKGAANPAREVPLPVVPPPLPRSIPVLAVARILHHVKRRTKTRARLAVIATTGMAHAELRKLRPQDIDWAGGTVFIQGRMKGGGTRARRIPLTTHSRLALAVFARRNAWGHFSGSSMHSKFVEACERAGYPKSGWRPYDLRHTLATQLAHLTRDEGAVQAWLGHTNVSTTQRYTMGSVNARLVAGGLALNRQTRKPSMQQEAQ